MKKNKMLLAALSSASVLALSAGLAACGDDGLSADDWSKAIDAALQCKSYTRAMDQDGFSMTLKADSENLKYSVSQSSSSASGFSVVECVYAKKDESYLQYSRAYGATADDSAGSAVWTKSEITETEFDQSTAMFQADVALTLIAGVKERFDSFTYNKTDKSYEAVNLTLGNAGAAEKVTAVLQDGALSSFIVQNLASENDGKITYTYSDLNKTSVTIPTAGGDVGNGGGDVGNGDDVTETIWEQAVTGLGVIGINANVTLKAYSAEIDEGGSAAPELDDYYTYEISGAKRKLLIAGDAEDDAIYLELDPNGYNAEDGEYDAKEYEHYQDGWKWRATSCTLDYDLDLGLQALTTFAWDKFDYDDAADTFTGKSDAVFIYPLEAGLMTFTNVKVKFDGGKLSEVTFDCNYKWIMEDDNGNEYVAEETNGIYKFEFTKHGSTGVTLPAGAIENVGGGIGVKPSDPEGLAGKTFVFESLTLNDDPDAEFTEYYAKSTFAFQDADSVIYSNPTEGTINGTYEANGAYFTITLRAANVPDMVLKATYDKVLVVTFEATTEPNGAGDPMHFVMIFVEQTT